MAGCVRSLPPPTLEGVEPGLVWNGAATPVRIRGEGFYLGFLGPLEGRGDVFADAQFELVLSRGEDSAPLESVAWESQESLLALVPVGLSAGMWDLDLVRPDGEAAKLLGAVAVVDALPPQVEEVSPTVLPSDLATEVSIFGSALDPGATVMLGELTIPVIVAAGALLVAQAPIGLDAGFYPLSVRNPDGELGEWDDLLRVVDRSVLPAVMTIAPEEISWGEMANVMLTVTNPSTTPADLDVTFTVDGPLGLLAESPREPIPAGGEATWWWILEAMGEGPSVVSVRGESPFHRLLPHAELVTVRRLLLQLTAPAMVTPGVPVVATLLVVNVGPAPVSDVTPSLFLSPSAGPSVSPQDPVPASSDLASGASVGFVYELTFDPLNSGVVTLSAQVAGLVGAATSASAVVQAEVIVL